MVCLTWRAMYGIGPAAFSDPIPTILMMDVRTHTVEEKTGWLAGEDGATFRTPAVVGFVTPSTPEMAASALDFGWSIPFPLILEAESLLLVAH